MLESYSNSQKHVINKNESEGIPGCHACFTHKNVKVSKSEVFPLSVQKGFKTTETLRWEYAI